MSRPAAPAAAPNWDKGMEPSNATRNATTPDPKWSFTVVSQIVFSALTVVLNAGMLLYFVKDKKLHTSFTVYLMFLLSANILYAISEYPLSVYQELSSPAPMGFILCSLNLYCGTAISCITMYTHLLITVNRIWALTFPISYKNHHSKRVAVLLCMGSLCYVNLTILAGFLPDLLYYRLPEEEAGRCTFNAEKVGGWLVFVQLIVFDLPVVMIAAAYPFLWHKESLRRRTIRAAKISGCGAKKTEASTERTDHPTKLRTGDELSIRPSKRDGRRMSRAFTILTLLTAGVFVCWTPNLAFWTAVNITGLYSPAADHVTATLHAFQTVLDPILFALSLGAFQKTIRKINFK